MAWMAIVVAILVAGSITPFASARTAVPGQSSSGQSTLSAQVTWDGTDVGSYASPSAALSSSFASNIDIHYAWRATAGPSSAPGLFNISDARLQIFYFGVALVTRDVLDANPQAAASGAFDMGWGGSYLEWVTAGIYRLTASLLAPNGTQMWAESFYIHVAAPYVLLAALPLVLIVIGAYETYALLTSGRLARRPPSAPAKRPPGAKPATTPESPPDDPAAPPPAGNDSP